MFSWMLKGILHSTLRWKLGKLRSRCSQWDSWWTSSLINDPNPDKSCQRFEGKWTFCPYHSILITKLICFDGLLHRMNLLISSRVRLSMEGSAVNWQRERDSVSHRMIGYSSAIMSLLIRVVVYLIAFLGRQRERGGTALSARSFMDRLAFSSVYVSSVIPQPDKGKKKNNNNNKKKVNNKLE